MSNPGGNPSSTWTIERVDTLRRMWAAGYSFSEIANELACGFTRNACIGKATRLGLRDSGTKRQVRSTVKATGTNRDGNAGMARRINKAKKEKTPPVVVELPAPYDFRGVTLMDLQIGQCRYPQGDAPVLFCGSPAEPGTSWCAHCRKIVFTPRAWSDKDRRDHGRLIKAAQRAKRRTEIQQVRAA